MTYSIEGREIPAPFIKGGLLYVAPKALTYLCTRSTSITEGKTSQIREKCATFQEEVKELVGPKAWFILTDVIADNAWISYLVVSYLRQSSSPTAKAPDSVEIASALISFSAASWLVRLALIKRFPFLREYIATRSYS